MFDVTRPRACAWAPTAAPQVVPRRWRSDAAPRPRIAVHRIGAIAIGPGRDKSTEEGGHQDQSATMTTCVATAQGLHVEADAAGVYSSAEFPDGFRWTQVITTNAPLHGATSPYVDPQPNDDSKPFYWTDAEEATHAGSFTDYPGRTAPATGATTWHATLCLNGVDGGAKTAKVFDCIGYGFTLDSAGTVTVDSPVSASDAGHRATLASGFPDWTFSGP